MSDRISDETPEIVTKFRERLTQLRQKKDVSAREMSLAIGQNPSYINRIENGKSLPGMDKFFYICEYLRITPEEFFRFDVTSPREYSEVSERFQTLDEDVREAMNLLLKNLNNRG